MKSITLHIDERTLRALRRHLTARAIAGASDSLPEAALGKVLQALEAGEPEVTLQLKPNAQVD